MQWRFSFSVWNVSACYKWNTILFVCCFEAFCFVLGFSSHSRDCFSLWCEIISITYIEYLTKLKEKCCQSAYCSVSEFVNMLHPLLEDIAGSQVLHQNAEMFLLVILAHIEFILPLTLVEQIRRNRLCKVLWSRLWSCCGSCRAKYELTCTRNMQSIIRRF